MDKAFFVSTFSSYTDEQLLEVVKSKANMQPEAVAVAGEILTSRGKQKDIDSLGGLYTKGISDLDQRISKVKIYRGLTLLVLFIILGVIEYTGIKPSLLGGAIVIGIAIVPFSLKITELKQQKKDEEAEDTSEAS